MKQSSSLPKAIEKCAKKFFGSNNLLEAVKLLKQSKTLISFSKGHPQQYFIVSGIVKGHKTYECKVVYKKRLEGSREGPLKSFCNCSIWEEESQCPHTAGLYVSFLLKMHYQENPTFFIDKEASFKINKNKYGTIIDNSYQLTRPDEDSYSSFQNFLHDNKAVNFPIPECFSGEIIICVKQVKTEENNEFTTNITFQYKDTKGVIHEKISLFKNLYLFNWVTGQAYHLPDEIKKFIQIIRPNLMDTDECIDFYQRIYPTKTLKLIIDGKKFEDIEEESMRFQLILSPDKKRNLIHMEFSFVDSEQNSIPAPRFLRLLCFEGGRLQTFRKKKNAYHFISALYHSILQKSDVYKKAMYLSSSKDEWFSLIKFTKEEGKFIHYNYVTRKKYSLKNETILTLFTSLYQNYGESLFRYSCYSEANMALSYNITYGLLFKGLEKFYNKFHPLGLSVFYDKKAISSWNSKMFFERKASTTKWFDFELNVTKEDLEVIKNADIETGIVLTKKGLILLNDKQKNLLKFMKRYIQYDSNENDENDDEESNEIKKFFLPFSRSRIFELFEIKRLGIEGTLTQNEEDLCKRLTNLTQLPSYPIPSDIRDILRPYQKTGLNWLRFLYENHLGACLADDMGLGKTIQTIAFIRSVIDVVEKILIVCPVSILLNWEKEFKKFSSIDVHLYHGGERVFPDNQKVILTSYGIMKKEIEETFKNKNFDILILDEVQHLKNIRSLGAFAARKLSAKFRVCLTGTPVENDISEFYNILDLSMPGVWGDFYNARSMSIKQSHVFAKKTAGPFVLRRTKGQVLTELPPKQEHNVFLNFTRREREFYQKSLFNIKRQIILSPKNKKYGEILKALLFLRQRCLWQKTAEGLFSTKIDFLMVQLEQILAENYQAIIFSQFTTYLGIIGEFLHQKGQEFAKLDGTQNIKTRQQEVDAFQRGDKRIFLISLKAGGIGLNLTAASYVFLMDPWWNPAVEQQAIDRSHRIGQKNTLIVYKPIIKDSIEEKVLELKETKKVLFDELLNKEGETLFKGNLSMKDFEYFFESPDLFQDPSVAQ